MKSLRILIDLDEVLADFVQGACSAWGVKLEDVLYHWTAGCWDMVPPLSAVLGRKHTMLAEEFWRPLNFQYFWENLQPTAWARLLIQEVSKITEDWHIISAPSKCVTSYVGKVNWLKDFFGADFDRFAITPHKSIFACKEVVLIDDRESNIDEFRRSGGRGILFPRYHNSLHEFRNDPMATVSTELALDNYWHKRIM